MIFDLKVNSRKIESQDLANEKVNGFIPGIIYGPGSKENLPVSIKLNDFKKVYEEAGESSLVNLSVGDEAKPHHVIVKSVDLDPLSYEIRHVDFYEIKEGQKLNIVVKLNFIGEAPAIKVLHGILVTNFDTVEVRCLPTDMISEVDVDISKLANFEDHVTLGELPFPKTVEVLDDLNSVVCLVTMPEEEKIEVKPVVEAAATPVAGAAPLAGEAAAAPAAKAPTKK